MCIEFIEHYMLVTINTSPLCVRSFYSVCNAHHREQTPPFTFTLVNELLAFSCVPGPFTTATPAREKLLTRRINESDEERHTVSRISNAKNRYLS